MNHSESGPRNLVSKYEDIVSLVPDTEAVTSLSLEDLQNVNRQIEEELNQADELGLDQEKRDALTAIHGHLEAVFEEREKKRNAVGEIEEKILALGRIDIDDRMLRNADEVHSALAAVRRALDEAGTTLSDSSLEVLISSFDRHLSPAIEELKVDESVCEDRTEGKIQDMVESLSYMRRVCDEIDRPLALISISSSVAFDHAKDRLRKVISDLEEISEIKWKERLMQG